MSAFIPYLSYITAITNDNPAVVTFSAEHSFTTGELVALRVSKQYGMVEANNKVAKVLAYDSLTITLDLDTLQFTPFVYPISTDLQRETTPPHAVPAGSGVIPQNVAFSGVYNSQPFGTTLIDLFDNRPTS